MLDSGNAVEQSPFHEEYIYVTTKQGNLAVLSATDGILLTTIQPATKSFLVEGEIFNGTITSSSGISFGYLEDRSQFLVYTVVDVPPAEIDGSSET